jgi:signal transduction histidine kinase
VKLALKKGTESISMAIEDNGVGFSVETDKVKGNGLHNMEERVKLLNGSLSIGSDNTGTKLNIFIPLKK